jgi:hypothetical protein
MLFREIIVTFCTSYATHITTELLLLENLVYIVTISF